MSTSDGIAGLINTAQKIWEDERTRGRQVVTVCLDTSSLAVGAQATLDALRVAIDRSGHDVILRTSGSWGFCWLEPTVSVRSAAGGLTILYHSVTKDRVEEFVQRTIVEGETMPELALGVVEGNATAEIGFLEEHPFMQGQIRRLMERSGRIDPEDINHYLALGGYEGFAKALGQTDEQIIEEMLNSGLGGRGGGGFPAGRKWDFLRTATADPRYLVCNADEGDPGAWVNRILLEGDPHLVVEGMLIAALATSALEGYIYIRHEYPLAIRRMQRAVDQARDVGLLGPDALGEGRPFDLVVFAGAGSYVCGEETGLMSSIDGYRGMPRIRPPFPAQAGLWNKPSNVNNVETYANAPLIFRNGSEWWSSVSDAEEKGTKMFTISGAVNQACCVEVPFGISVRELMEHYGGGLRGDAELKGYQPGGPLSGLLPAAEVDLPLALAPFRERGMFLGSGGIVFFDQSTSVLDLCTYFLDFCEDESCGRCTTCFQGTQRALEILRRIGQGGGRAADYEKLNDLIQALRWSNCLHGQFAPTSVKLALIYFRDEFEVLINEQRDPTRSLPGLIRYVITDPTASELEIASDLCPTDAIVENNGRWKIIDDACIKCDACREVAPRAVEVIDRFEIPLIVQ
jgi:NADH-quinone oxidoreductase subunit F